MAVVMFMLAFCHFTQQVVLGVQAVKRTGALCKPNRLQCVHVSFERQGCFYKNARGGGVISLDYEPLAKVIDAFLSSNRNLFSNQNLSKWLETQADFTCMCANETQNVGYHFFALQQMYECYAGPEQGFKESDRAPDLKCIADSEQKHCTDNETWCTGGARTVAVFKIVSNRAQGPDDCTTEPQEGVTDRETIHGNPTPKAKSAAEAKLAVRLLSSKEELNKLFDELSAVRNITQILKIVREIIDIFRRQEFYESFQDFKEYQEKFISMLSKKINEEYKPLWKRAQQIQNLISLMEELPSLFLRSMVHNRQGDVRNGQEYQHGNIFFQSTLIDLRRRRPQLLLKHGGDSLGSKNAISINMETLPISGSFGIAVILYSNISDIHPADLDDHIITRSGQKRFLVVSPVVSIVARHNSKQISNINATIHLKLNERYHLQNKVDYEEDESLHCAFWKKNASLISDGVWSTAGVTLTDSFYGNTSIGSCRTNHLTSFAILMQTAEFKLSPHHQYQLEIITYVGSSISLVCLLASAISLPILRLKSIRYKIHQQLCIALTVAQLVLLTGTAAKRHKIACMIVAIVLHYFYTAAFSWMLVEGVHLYIKIVIAYETKHLKQVYYFGFGWGLPIVIVGISSAANHNGYGSEIGCWLSLEKGFRWVFIGPVLIILLINTFIMVRVLHVMMTLHNDPIKGKKQPSCRLRAAAKGVAILLPLLGVTWVFGVISVNSHTIAFQYIFAILNTLQGAFIFFFNFATNREVQSSLRNTLRTQSRSVSV